MPKPNKTKGPSAGQAAAAAKVTKKAAKAKALKAQLAVTKGTFVKRNVKARYNVHFILPKTKTIARDPKYPRHSVPRKNPLTQNSVLKHPLVTESAMRKVEENNTLVFIVDPRANKSQIKAAIKKMYQLKADKVNTLVRPDGKKKAYIKLSADHDALDEANKIGII